MHANSSGGVPLGILDGSVQPCSPDLASKKLCHIYLDQNANKKDS